MMLQCSITSEHLIYFKIEDVDEYIIGILTSLISLPDVDQTYQIYRITTKPKLRSLIVKAIQAGSDIDTLMVQSLVKSTECIGLGWTKSGDFENYLELHFDSCCHMAAFSANNTTMSTAVSIFRQHKNRPYEISITADGYFVIIKDSVQVSPIFTSILFAIDTKLIVSIADGTFQIFDTSTEELSGLTFNTYLQLAAAQRNVHKSQQALVTLLPTANRL